MTPDNINSRAENIDDPNARFAARMLEARYPEQYGDGPRSEEEITANVRAVMADELEANGITWESEQAMLEQWVQFQESREEPLP